jgi:hypothetical protein
MKTTIFPLAAFFSHAVAHESGHVEPKVTPLNYTDGGFLLQGFLSIPDMTPTPAVVIIPD